MATNDAFKNVSATYEETSPYPPPVPPLVRTGPDRTTPVRETSLRQNGRLYTMRITERQREFMRTFPEVKWAEAVRRLIDGFMGVPIDLSPSEVATRQREVSDRVGREMREEMGRVTAARMEKIVLRGKVVEKLRTKVAEWPRDLPRRVQLVRLAALVSAIPVLRPESRESLLDELLNIPPEGL